MVGFGSEEWRWNPEQFNAVMERVRERLLEVTLADQAEVFNQAIVPLVQAATAAAADLADLNSWRHGRPCTDPSRIGEYEHRGDGSEEVDAAGESISMFVMWIAWLVGEQTSDE
jgi:hypothetical protein